MSPRHGREEWTTKGAVAFDVHIKAELKIPRRTRARSSHVVSFRSVRSLGSPPPALPLTAFSISCIVDTYYSILDVVLNDDQVHSVSCKEPKEP